MRAPWDQGYPIWPARLPPPLAFACGSSKHCFSWRLNHKGAGLVLHAFSNQITEGSQADPAMEEEDFAQEVQSPLFSVTLHALLICNTTGAPTAVAA